MGGVRVSLFVSGCTNDVLAVFSHRHGTGTDKNSRRLNPGLLRCLEADYITGPTVLGRAVQPENQVALIAVP